MRDIPIIFSAPMVRALLEDRKTQTRRLAVTTPKPPKLPRPSPWTKVKPDDLLWVKENVTRFDKDSCDQHIWYWAGMNGVYDHNSISAARLIGRPGGDWPKDTEGPGTGKAYSVPCIHMPRWASRLTLDVEAVKIEPLQDISEAEAIAEGIGAIAAPGAPPLFRIYGPINPLIPISKVYALAPDTVATTDPRLSYASLWNSLHGSGSWESNPNVVATTFFVYRKSIRDILEARGIDTAARWAA